MILLRRMSALCAVLAATACGAIDPAEMEAKKLDGMDLSAAERRVAEALIAGYKKETGMPVLRSRDVGRAGCYAKKNGVATRHDRVHRDYLANYPDVDDDFYGWFQRRGVSEEAAWALWQDMEKGFKACSLGGLLSR